MSMTLTSAAFVHEGTIPSRHTCDGEDLSPPLAFGGVPGGTKSLVLLCDDPDAPAGVWDHWVLFNLSPGTPGLPEGLPAGASYADGSLSGKNSWGRLGYGGPCPPKGIHRYYFSLYALDGLLDLPSGTSKKDVLVAAKGHILASATLMGRYSRGRV
jgi:Raf kinase inhibitor-like YbhB/YbcL family protein